MSADIDPMAEIRASFFIECEELLEALQDGLETIEGGDDDPETINVVFRAVHSIKGGAGAFGLEALVRFAHRYETVLDEVRAGRMVVSPDALKAFFQAADHLSDLVRISCDGAALPDDETQKLLSLLDGLLGSAPTEDQEEPEIEFQPMGIALELSFDEDEAPQNDGFELGALPALDLSLNSTQQIFEIHFAPAAELFETGNEAALLLRNLCALGEATVVLEADHLREFAQMTPTVPDLRWRITLETDASKDDILTIFDFVEGLCTLRVSQAEDDPKPDAEPEPEETPARPATSDAEPPKQTSKAFSPAPNEKKQANTAQAKSVVRVDIDRIERLVNLVGELVINQAMLSQSLEQSGLSPHSDAMNGLEEFQRLTRDIQDSVMMIRAQPVKSLFQRMSRIIREASSAIQKEVRFHTIGEATEVDKTVIERLADPLTHMIRNAVDHGLENADSRIAAGKSPHGNVSLSAAHRSGRVVIEVSDDGAGINRPKVLQIAIDKGLIPPESNLSDSEIDNLLFLPGFSTAAVVSDLSGRGVGMDVVRTAIQALGGRITISSTPGEGTVFSISLPLTLAVLDGMVIEVADQTLVLPLNLVVETLTLADHDVDMVSPNRFVIKVRSGFVPVFDLGAALGYRAPMKTFEDAVILVIAREDDSQSALIIDNIVDQRQVVIKGLDEGFHRAPGIAAATILGDGQIALIVDPTDIIDSIASDVLPSPNLVEVGASA